MEDAGGISQEYGVFTVQVAVVPLTLASTLDSSPYTVARPVVSVIDIAETLDKQMTLPPVGSGVFNVIVATS